MVAAMLRYLIGTAAIIVHLAGIAHAQTVPGDSPNMGIGAAVANSRSRPLLGISRELDRYQPQDEGAYRQNTRNIPDRKPPKDPWAKIRHAPTAPPVDRHRVE